MGRGVAHKGTDQGKAARIEQLRLVFEERFPSRAAPYGSWGALAREIGMSRGWVNHLVERTLGPAGVAGPGAGCPQQAIHRSDRTAGEAV